MAFDKKTVRKLTKAYILPNAHRQPEPYDVVIIEKDGTMRGKPIAWPIIYSEKRKR